MNKRPKRIFIVSDSTGKTAERVLNAALVQFRPDVAITEQISNLRTVKQINQIIEEAVRSSGMIIYTLVSLELRREMFLKSEKNNVIAVDLLGTILNKLSAYLQSEPKEEPGLLHSVDDFYYKKIDALGFAVQHDDGQNLHDLHKADIILTGVSRTGKTPISITLARDGWLVANVPIFMELPLPAEFFKVDQHKIVGLTMDTKILSIIRQERAQSLTRGMPINYSDMDYIKRDVEYALKTFYDKKWPIINVTNRAIEETAHKVFSLTIRNKSSVKF